VRYPMTDATVPETPIEVFIRINLVSAQ